MVSGLGWNEGMKEQNINKGKIMMVEGRKEMEGRELVGFVKEMKEEWMDG